MVNLECAVLSAWYCSRPEIRRLLAIREAEGLRVLVQLEPSPDSGEIHPAWMANHHAWADELQWHTGEVIRLEQADDEFGAEVDTEAREDVIVDLSWRDPSLN